MPSRLLRSASGLALAFALIGAAVPAATAAEGAAPNSAPAVSTTGTPLAPPHSGGAGSPTDESEAPAVQKGWDAEHLHYYDDGVRRKRWLDDGGRRYFFDAKGEMCHG